ncbi:hypothetical protein BJX70DRAFT_245006 [Aspergillus crustosus]
MSTPSLSLHVNISIAPENLPRFFEALKPAFEKVTAEPECTFFEIYQDPQNPGELSWVENWSASVEWLVEVQLKREYYKPYLEITEPMFLRPREFKLLSRVAPYSIVKKSNGQILD